MQIVLRVPQPWHWGRHPVRSGVVGGIHSTSVIKRMLQINVVCFRLTKLIMSDTIWNFVLSSSCNPALPNLTQSKMLVNKAKFGPEVTTNRPKSARFILQNWRIQGVCQISFLVPISFLGMMTTFETLNYSRIPQKWLFSQAQLQYSARQSL